MIRIPLSPIDATQLAEKLKTISTLIECDRLHNAKIFFYTNINTLDKLASNFAMLNKLEECLALAPDQSGITDELKIAIESYRIKLLKILLSHLRQQRNNQLPVTSIDSDQKSNWSAIKNFLTKFFAFCSPLLAILGLCFLAIPEGIDSIGSVLMVIPNISTLAILVTCFIFSIINSSLFYLLEIKSIKKTLGLQAVKNLAPYLETIKESIQLTKEIHETLLMNSQLYAVDYFEICPALHENIFKKKNDLNTPYAEKNWTKALRGVFMVVGVVLMAGSAYFSASSALQIVLTLAFGAAFISSPVGFGIIVGFGVAAALTGAVYFILRNNRVYTSLNPIAQQKNAVKNQMNDYLGQEFPNTIKKQIDQKYKEKRNSQLVSAFECVMKKNNTVISALFHLINKNPPKKMLLHPIKQYKTHLRLFAEERRKKLPIDVSKDITGSNQVTSRRGSF